MSCGMAVPKLLVADSKPSIPQFPTEIQRTMTFPVQSPGICVLSLLCSAVLQELLQTQEWENCPSSCWWPQLSWAWFQCRTIILGSIIFAVIHPAAQLLLLPAEQSLVCTICMNSPCQNRSLWPSVDASSLLRHSHHSDSTAIKKSSLHKNEESEMKMKKNRL